MGMNPYHPTERELRISSALRDLAVREIERRDDLVGIAERLDMKTSGIKTLLWQPVWSFETAFRVADALGLPTASAIESVIAGDPLASESV